jgi:hypothetical protein
MGDVLLGLLALLSFYIGYVYLFNQDLAARWDGARMKMLGNRTLERTERWENRAKRRGISAIIVGLLLLGLMTGVI